MLPVSTQDPFPVSHLHDVHPLEFEHPDKKGSLPVAKLNDISSQCAYGGFRRPENLLIVTVQR